MPRKPATVCNKPGCPELRPCPIEGHEPKPWAGSTHNQNRRGSGWQEQRDHQRILKANPRCYLCGDIATQVDHIVALAEGGPDTDLNKRPICAPCHQAKTQAEAARARTRRL